MTQLALGPLMIDIAGTVLTNLDRQRLSHPLVGGIIPVSYTHLRANETVLDLVCRLLLDKKNN